jgi:flagellar hook protein FlgE
MSGLSASMWTSVSGLMVHGNKMNVVGNNLANVSTIGFKSQRADFCDYLYVGAGSVSGNTQIGQGAATYALIGDFSQGSFESTNSVTDIAIDGNGFFKVRKPNSENMFYSRAGDFYFNTDRELQNPEGYVLQGWKVNNRKTISFNNGSTNLGTTKSSKTAFVGTGSPVDIVLDSWNVIPQQTTNVTFTMGLTNDSTSDHTTNPERPMTALFEQWDAKNEPPMPDTAYAAQSSIKVYDEGGTTHELTVYYDKIADEMSDANGTKLYDINGLPAGYTMYEYVVTMPPSEDKRTYGGVYDPATQTVSGEKPFYSTDPTLIHDKAGVLMTGVMVFNGSGQLVNQTAYTYAAQDETSTGENHPNQQSNLDPDALASWQPTKFSNNGLPTFAPNFEGLPLANSVNETMLEGGAQTVTSQVQEHVIELDFGLKNLGMNWSPSSGTLADLNAVPSTTTVQGADRTTTLAADIPSGFDLTSDTSGATYTISYADGSSISVTAKTATDPTVKLTTRAANGAVTTYTVSDVTAQSVTGSYGTTELTVNFATPTVSRTTTATSNAGTTKTTTATTTFDGTTSGSGVTTATTISSTWYAAPYDKLALMSSVERQDYASAANSVTPTVQDAIQDGYGSGVLNNVNIDANGIVYGMYSNGKSLPLYQIALYDFKCEQGLYREGGNLFSATVKSGDPKQGVPGDNGFGSTRAYNIEQSNVDMAKEFVHMITTQRGFQANSKAITTTDSMLETVIGMKR